MKKIVLFASVFALVLVFTACEKDLYEGTALNLKSANSGKVTGFDQWGYNWNAHQFNGYLINAWFGDNIYQEGEVPWYHQEPPFDGDIEAYQLAHPEVLDYPFWMYGDMKIVMHWNESLISGDGVYQDPRLDTDAWITFHYSQGEGKNRWSQYQKFVAAKSTDYMVPSEFDGFGEWYNEEDEFLGYYYLWSDMILIQVVNTGNLPEGMLWSLKGPMGPGLGKNKSR